MPRGRPVNDETRARAIELMQAGKGRNEIARELGMSAGAVSAIATDVGHTFDWKLTELATRAATVQVGAMRTELARQALVRAFEALDAMSAPHSEIHWQAATEHQTGGWQEYVRDEPTVSDKRNYATIFGILTQRAADLMRSSEGAGVTGAAASVLDGLTGGIAAVADLLRTDPSTDPTAEPRPVSREDMIADLERRIADEGGTDDDDGDIPD